MKAAASGKHRRPLSLIFFIKFGFIPIASNQDIRHPVWRPTHDIADGFVINILAAFDDELMDIISSDLDFSSNAIAFFTTSISSIIPRSLISWSR